MREPMIAIFDSLPILSQRQDSITEQIWDMVAFANRLGCFDVADYLKASIERCYEPSYQE